MLVDKLGLSHVTAPLPLKFEHAVVGQVESFIGHGRHGFCAVLVDLVFEDVRKVVGKVASSQSIGVDGNALQVIDVVPIDRNEFLGVVDELILL